MYQIASSSTSSSTNHNFTPENRPWQTPFSQFFEDFESLEDFNDPTFVLNFKTEQNVEPTYAEPAAAVSTLQNVPPVKKFEPKQPTTDPLQRPMKRVRGRPRGNPPKLNLEQRRQRNAELERERRAELSDAYRDLQNSVSGLSEQEASEALTDELSRAQLLEKAIHMIQSGTSSDEIATIKRQNENLMRQIEMLEARMLQEMQ